MILTSSMKFNLGQLVITTAALETIPADDICESINRHVCGDFGSIAEDDRKVNELALRVGGQIVSAYFTATGTEFFIHTAADRTTTTVLLPHETIEL